MTFRILCVGAIALSIATSGVARAQMERDATGDASLEVIEQIDFMVMVVLKDIVDHEKLKPHIRCIVQDANDRWLGEGVTPIELQNGDLTGWPMVYVRPRPGKSLNAATRYTCTLVFGSASGQVWRMPGHGIESGPAAAKPGTELTNELKGSIPR